MIKSKRRGFLKRLGMGLAAIPFSFAGIMSLFANNKKEQLPGRSTLTSWKGQFGEVNDRVWIGEDYWAIPMEDWRMNGGRIEFIGKGRFSRVNLLTAVIGEDSGSVDIICNMGTLSQHHSANGSAGFCIGVKDKVDNNVKSACYFGNGINAGVSLQGELFIGSSSRPLPNNFDFTNFNLSINGTSSNSTAELILMCKDGNGNATKIVHYVKDRNISGLITLVNGFKEAGGEQFWFKDLEASGTALTSMPGNSFGPILWSMYTLSKGTLRLSAQMPPVSIKDDQVVKLMLRKGDSWTEVSTAEIEHRSYLAQFSLNGWAGDKDQRYKLVYENNGKEYEYQGTIRKEPLDGQLRLASLTCQEANAYPYTPLVENLKRYDPDMAYFSGDQLYEGNGGYPIKREPEEKAILSYLGKWYMFGWAFGDIMRNRPTICTPDDHDVFHGNLWGDGGKNISLEQWKKAGMNHGGYVQTPNMVNVVSRTQCGHMPTAFHTDSLPSGIQPWYTDLLYGKISFAIISDRMFKSGPEVVRKGSGRVDHIKEPLRPEQLENPGSAFLGQRQMEFLEHWVSDWEDANMKVLLSQTLFANVATHHGNDKMFLYGDMDSGGWPKRKKDEALRLVRKACAFHVNGDQHLPFIVQYGLEQPKDAGWTFCAPAISTGYMRWAEPDILNTPYTDRPEHHLPNTGLYKDVFGNENYIYAVGNPKDDFINTNRYLQAQNKSSGFGIIDFDTDKRTISMDAVRFLADKDKPAENDHFPGWPFKISQTDNDGRKPMGFLPIFKINKSNQLVKIIWEENNELVSILRINGTSYQPGIYQKGTYTVVIGEGQSIKEFKKIMPTSIKSDTLLRVDV